MFSRSWSVSRQRQGGILLLRLPEATRPLGEAAPSPGGSDHWEAVAGDDHRERLLSALLPANRHWLVVSDRAAGRRPELHAAAWVEDVATTDRIVRVKLDWWKDRAFVLVPPGDAGLQGLALQSMSGDDEHRPDFVFVCPPGTRTWHVQDLARWCASKHHWMRPEAVVPAQAELLLACFDGDVYCAEADTAESRCVEAATRWAASHDVSVNLREESAWLPGR